MNLCNGTGGRTTNTRGGDVGGSGNDRRVNSGETNMDRLISEEINGGNMWRGTTNGGPGVWILWVKPHMTSLSDDRWMGEGRSDG